MPIPFFSKKKSQPIQGKAAAGAPASSKGQKIPNAPTAPKAGEMPKTADAGVKAKASAGRAPLAKAPNVPAPRAVQQVCHPPARGGNPAAPRVPVRRPPVPGVNAAKNPNQPPRDPRAVHPSGSPQKQPTPKSAIKTVDAAPHGQTRPIKQPKPPKEPRGPLITAEGVSAFLFVVTVSVLIYAIVCGIAYGVFYGINHFRFEWDSDITVKLDDSSNRPTKYTTSKKLVFRNGNDEAYIAMSRLAQSFGLSSVGDSGQMKFYKTGDLQNSVVFVHKSNEAIVNGVTVRLPAPVYISGATAYVPIAFFNYYTTGVTMTYDSEHLELTVFYTINEELSTPKRKVLEEFRFAVNTPSGLEEMTEEEWFEYVGNIS